MHTTLLSSWLHSFAYVGIFHSSCTFLGQKAVNSYSLRANFALGNVNTAKVGAFLFTINRFLYKLPIERTICKKFAVKLGIYFKTRWKLMTFGA